MERVPFYSTKFGTSFTDFVLAVTTSTALVKQEHAIEIVGHAISLKRVSVCSAEDTRLVILRVGDTIACSRNGASR